MNKEELRDYCINLPDVEETFPFDDVSLVMKIGGKMFALIPLDTTETSISVKCDPELAIELREKYECIKPAYHFNKKHWNTIYILEGLDKQLIMDWIKHSYDLVKAGLPKKVKEQLSGNSNT